MKAKLGLAVAGVCLATLLAFLSSPAQAGGSKGTVLVINANSNDVTLINPKKREVITEVRVGNHPIKLVVDNKNRFAFVINQGSDDLSIINLKTLTVLDVPLGFEPRDIAATPKGDKLVILHANPEQASGGEAFKGDYSIYDVKKGELVTNFLNGTSATGNPDVCAVAADSNGDLVWITACVSDEVVVIDLKKAMNGDSGDEVKTVLPTGANPAFIAISTK
ncbi:MAG: YncE family protein [Myxococcota bacterium]